MSLEQKSGPENSQPDQLYLVCIHEEVHEDDQGASVGAQHTTLRAIVSWEIGAKYWGKLSYSLPLKGRQEYLGTT